MAIKFIENGSFVHTKIICISSSCNYIKSEFGIIEFVFEIPFLNAVTVERWKSERPVSEVLLCSNRLGRFVSIRSIHEGLARFEKHAGTFIKLCRQFISQKIFTAFLVNTYIKFSYENKVIIGFAMFIDDAV